MSTRCLIGKENQDNSITYIYCHHDGYPSWVGKVLFENYKDEEKIDKLLALGDMSSLGKEPVSTGDFRYLGEDFCCPYSDRGESHPAETVKTQKAFLNVDAWEEYWYLFKDNKWYYSSDGNTFKELTETVIARD